MRITRRRGLEIGLSLLCGAGPREVAIAQDQHFLGSELKVRHGLSPFGHLELPPDFPHFPYTDPSAPKGGMITLQARRPIANQNPATFNTLNIYVLRGDGAAGIQSTFDSLMVPSLDERNAVYGLLARNVTTLRPGKHFRFSLRPEARFHDGSAVTANDVAYSLTLLKEKGHPIYRNLLADLLSATAKTNDVLELEFSATADRDAALVAATMPVFSRSFWKDRDFEGAILTPILGSGPYKVRDFEVGRFVEFERVADYWGSTLPVNIGLNNFDRIKYVYFRDRQVAAEAFKAGEITFVEEQNARSWATGYDFPAVRDGRVKKIELPVRGTTPIAGWFLNTRREKFSDRRVREALCLAFDFEWTNRNIMFSMFKRVSSYFQNSDMMATGLASAEEVSFLRKIITQIPNELLDLPFSPPVSDGSGSDRLLLRRATELLANAGYLLDGDGVLKGPNGQPFTLEFLYSSNALQAETGPFIANLRKLGISASYRVVDPVQFIRRRDDFDFEAIPVIYVGSLTPGTELRSAYSSEAANTIGSRNFSGIADPLVDATIEQIIVATSREALIVYCRVLDRILRAGRYWIPLWYRDQVSIAYWDKFSAPLRSPAFASGAPETWWSSTSPK